MNDHDLDLVAAQVIDQALRGVAWCVLAVVPAFAFVGALHALGVPFAVVAAAPVVTPWWLWTGGRWLYRTIRGMDWDDVE